VVPGCRGLHSFLSVERSLPKANLLVIEGWVKDTAVTWAVERYRNSGRYDFVCATGGDRDQGGYVGEHDNWASLTEARLLHEGLSSEEIVTAPAGQNFRHRTYAAAVALREKLEADGIEIRGIEIVTSPSHSRRSTIVYEKVFQEIAPVGSLAAPLTMDGPADWWKTSRGTKLVVMEMVALLYEWIADGGR